MKIESRKIEQRILKSEQDEGRARELFEAILKLSSQGEKVIDLRSTQEKSLEE